MQPNTPPPSSNESQPQGFYRPGESAGYSAPQQPVSPAGQPQPLGQVEWEASEYVHHDKGMVWVAGLILAALVLCGVAIWLQAWTFLILIIVMALTMGFFAFRPPRAMRYSVSGTGVRMGDKFYNYDQFRAFGVLQDGAFYTMMFIPTKRFMPGLSLYFSEAEGEKIIDIVGNHLPMEDLQPDLFDTLMQKIRF